MNELRIGQMISQDYTVTSADLTSKLGNGSVDVLATLRLVVLMEGVCTQILNTYLPEGIAPIGPGAHIKYLASTVEGVTVHPTTRLIESDGRKFAFEVEVFDDVGLTPTYMRERASIKCENYLKRVAKRVKQ